MSYSKQNFRSGDTLYASQLNAMDDEIAALEAEVESTKNMVGSPLTASTAAGMTDQTKIYVYTGTETGYTAGHWYYYNGTAWTDGGVYNSVAVNTDTSLTVPGQAADSKAVGDAIDDLDSDLSDVKSDLNQNHFTPKIEGSGNIDISTGEVVTNAQYSYSEYKDISDFEKLITDSGYECAFNAFYTANKVFISSFTIREGSGNVISIPDNAVYIRVSSSNSKYVETNKFRTLSRINAGRIDELDEAVNNLAERSDSFTPAINDTGYISRETGEVVASGSYSHSDYVDISDFRTLTTDALQGSAFNAFYTANKTFIDTFSVAAGTNQTITIPDNAVYMRLSTTTAKYMDTFIFRMLSHSNAIRIAELENTVETLEGQGTDYFSPPIIGTGNISTSDGSVVTNASYSVSDYVDISDFKVLTTYASYESAFNAFYTANKAFISAFVVRTGDNKTITIPDNAAYMRVSASTSKYYDTFIFGALSHANAARIKSLEDTVDNLMNGDTDYFLPPSEGTGNISRDDGSIVTSSYLHSDYIDISQFPKIRTVALYSSSFNAFYDANKTFISAFNIEVGTDKIIVPPPGAVYMRVSASSSKYNDTMHFRTLDYILADALPEYWVTHIVPKCETIKNRMATIGKFGDTFPFLTDIHWYRNEQRSPALVKYLLNHLNINMVVLGGDLITQGEKNAEIDEAMKVVKAYKYPDIFVPTVFGNHDNNSNQDNASYRFDNNAVYSLFFKGFEDHVTFMTDTEDSFYFDKDVNKTRYIFLDMGDDGVSKAFTAFAEFRDALASTPSGYKIVIVAHIIDYGTFATHLMTIIDAYNARTSVTLNDVVYDFTTASGSVVICLGGHRHYDAEISTSGGVPITLTDCDAMLSVTEITEVAGTITEQAFDVVSLDYTNMIAYYERIGRGNSRIIHMTPVSASTALTTTLTGTITWTSSNTSVATVSNGTITRLTSGTVVIKADNGTASEIWICNS